MGYTEIENSRNAVQLVWADGALYRRDRDGSIWRWDYTYPYNKTWTSISRPEDLTSIVGTKDFLYKLQTNGKLFRFLRQQNEWVGIHDYGHIQDAIASDDSYYYILADGRVAVDGMMHPLQSYAQLEKLYKNLQSTEQVLRSDISRLESIKKQDENIILQLRSAVDQETKKEKTQQDRILQLERALLNAQAAEAKLTADLDAEKKKEHDEWKKAQEHDAEDHKALEQAHIRNVELQSKIDGLNKEIVGLVIPGLQKTIEGLNTDIGEHQKLIDVLKKQQGL
ncbi:hypothetical protein G7Z17_g3431 [Cylindrodendrum hubeiense]|uniref:Uncharacterized protein n=1 Tax=Cylindrodendrum hubeiense TaxID=595255 RepID=A0A9P5LJZ1_9HYPO|nr:hypothetical protein G7Z17_g3431 [Cylindrodendrum hubeiense]